MRGVRAAAVIGCISAVAVVGCGSSKKSSTSGTQEKAAITIVSAAPVPLPQPRESIGAFAKRLAAAHADAAAGRCASVTSFASSAGLNLPCQPGKPTPQFAGFKVLGTATYGSGAVIEATDAEVAAQHVAAMPGVTPKVQRNTAVFPVAQSKAGSYVYLPVTGAPVLQGSVIGTTPNGWSQADTAAVTFFKSVRDNDCATWFRYSITPRGMSKSEACAVGLNKFYAPLHQQLASHPAKLWHLGGNEFVYFYGVQVGGLVGTLAVSRNNSPSAPPFVAVGTARAGG